MLVGGVDALALPSDLGRECWRARVGHPNLDRPKAPAPEIVAVAGGAGAGCRLRFHPSHVTRRLGTCKAFLPRPRPVRRVVAAPMASLCLSAITEGELLSGLAKRPDTVRLRRAVTELLRRVDVLAWDSDAAQHYGSMRADAERGGRILGLLDRLIAAPAWSRDAVLVSNDRAFGRVSGLAVVDWMV